jgi:hypothetical protein
MVGRHREPRLFQFAVGKERKKRAAAVERFDFLHLAAIQFDN